MRSHPSYLLIAALVSIGCDDDPLEAASPSSIESDSTEDGIEEAAGDDADPCDRFPPALVRTVLELPADTEIEGGQGSHVQHVCSYHWANPEYDPRAHAKRLMQKFGPGSNRAGQADALTDEIVEAPANFTASFTQPAPDADAEQAHTRFEAAVRRLEEGVTAKAGGRETTFRSDTERVDGVGDEAVWFVRTRELVVRSGAQRLTFGARIGTDRDANIAAATKLAKAVLDS